MTTFDQYNKDEVFKVIKDLGRIYGSYELARMVVRDAQQSSAEYQALGNHGAIVHRDYFHLIYALGEMKRSHPLRVLDILP